MRIKSLLLLIIIAISLLIATSCELEDINNNNDTYTIAFVDYDGTILQTSQIEKGGIPSYTKGIPTRANDDNYSYTFNGWSPVIEIANKDAIYIATYTQTSLAYTITFKDYDGTILQTSVINAGEIPTFNKSNPTRINDDNYSYTFSGWAPQISKVNKDTTYTATYTQKSLPYEIIINLNGGTSSSTKLQFKTDNVTKDILPFDVKKKGYIFRGYDYKGILVYDENGNSKNNFTLSSNMIFNAVFEESVILNIFYTLYNPKTNQIINTYTEKPSEIGNISETRSYNYNKYVDLFAYPNEGYTFVGWYNEGQVLSNEENYKYMMWDEDCTLEARFKYTLYDLKVWSNSIDLGLVLIRDGNSQVFYNEEVLKEYYTESVTIVAYSKTDTRFLGWYNEENELVSPNAVYTFNMLNRDYTLEAKWNSFDIIYDLDGGVNNELNPTTYNVDMSNITLKTPTKEGYTFQGWEYESNVITIINTTNVCHMNLKALWTVNTDTPYKVEHYKQNIDNDNFTLYETDNLTGTTNTLTNGSVKTYEGFTSPTITQVNINGDGKTVIKLYYARNTYTISLTKNVDKAGTITGGGTYKYGKELTITATTNDGYTFNGWYDGNTLVSNKLIYTFTMPASNIIYTAKWITDTDTPYKVEHYQQNIDNNNYALYETDNLTGETNTITNGSVKTYEGFTSPTITQVNINGDGNTVIKLYYTRNKYTISLNKNVEKAGSITSGGTYKYGKELTITATTNDGYTFSGWYNGNTIVSNKLSYTFTMPASNLVYTAKWITDTDTPYKVEHYQQNIDNSNYTLYETDNLTGTTDSLTNGSVKTYEGFTSPTITQVNINGDGKTVIKLYYTRNTYTISLNKNIDKAGTITSGGIYKYGKEITIEATTNDGYTFNGWYNGNTLVSNKSSYTFTMLASNMVYIAKYSTNKYTITIDNQSDGVTILGITSENEYEYNSQITLTATNIPTGYTIKWVRSDGVVFLGDVYSFRVPANNTIVTTVSSLPYIKNDNKIYFGRYPQTRVTDNTLVNELNLLAGTKPTSTNKYNWTDYNYYISSNISSYMYYQDIDYDNDGVYDFRGVYFTHYRPENFSYSSSTSSTWQDDNGFSTNTRYWFSYDLIEWDMLTESNGKALIIANLILDSQEFYPGGSNNQFSHNGGTGYSNNYELSAIRKYLNDNFYNTAFNELQKAIIEITEVDNNTNDKMFLLSIKDVKTYYTSGSKIAKGTDYAKVQGLWVNSRTGYSNWWLRSPNYHYAYEAYYVDRDGTICSDCPVGHTCYGVRPACWINL